MIIWVWATGKWTSCLCQQWFFIVYLSVTSSSSLHTPPLSCCHRICNFANIFLSHPLKVLLQQTSTSPRSYSVLTFILRLCLFAVTTHSFPLLSLYLLLLLLYLNQSLPSTWLFSAVIGCVCGFIYVPSSQ